ncbi:hypothetical protein RFI_08874 [Reticulomyxa filosa]|uniref:Uncharacterized protein n=1 Tax=Reticulomyxa filosa TaxID=46433 RepID=X6NRA4_RETFI|nr:hypothetical protein RFI_08874 [Reticulomyxa filosa]|eukprot:ETO28259.1 hypothetical protein RFI_08874 [Reticulomyxa filosa]
MPYHNNQYGDGYKAVLLTSLLELFLCVSSVRSGDFFYAWVFGVAFLVHLSIAFAFKTLTIEDEKKTHLRISFGPLNLFCCRQTISLRYDEIAYFEVLDNANRAHHHGVHVLGCKNMTYLYSNTKFCHAHENRVFVFAIKEDSVYSKTGCLPRRFKELMLVTTDVQNLEIHLQRMGVFERRQIGAENETQTLI